MASTTPFPKRHRQERTMALAARHHPDGYLGIRSMHYVQLANGLSFFLFA